jgi:hypothetical protein
MSKRVKVPVMASNPVASHVQACKTGSDDQNIDLGRGFSWFFAR